MKLGHAASWNQTGMVLHSGMLKRYLKSLSVSLFVSFCFDEVSAPRFQTEKVLYPPNLRRGA